MKADGGEGRRVNNVLLEVFEAAGVRGDRGVSL